MLNVAGHMWLSIRDIADKFGIKRATVIDMIEHKLLPKPAYFPIHNRFFHWQRDELELFLFKNAKQSLNVKPKEHH